MHVLESILWNPLHGSTKEVGGDAGVRLEGGNVPGKEERKGQRVVVAQDVQVKCRLTGAKRCAGLGWKDRGDEYDERRAWARTAIG